MGVLPALFRVLVPLMWPPNLYRLPVLSYPPSLYRLPVQGQPPSLHRLLVQVLKFCPPALSLRIEQATSQLVFTSRVMYRKMRLTRTSLKMPTTGRLSEGSDPSWAGIRSLTTTIHLLPWMIILLPVPEPNQPAKSQ